MSLQHFFLEKQVLREAIAGSAHDAKNAESTASAPFKLEVTPKDLHHMAVLRLSPGEHIGVIDAAGVFYECEIVHIDSNSVHVKNCSKTVSCCENKLQVWLCAGILKGSKYDEVVRHCTELGTDGFIPVKFDRCVSKLDEKKENAKISRWERIAKSAATQSGQKQVPAINRPCDVDSLCEMLKGFDVVVLCWEEATNAEPLKNLRAQVLNDVETHRKNDSKQNTSKQKASQPQKIAVIIGPEGGITPEEVVKIEKCGCRVETVLISNTILRAETACISAMAIVKFCLDM